MSRRGNKQDEEFLVKIIVVGVVFIIVFVAVFVNSYVRNCIWEWPIRWDVKTCWNEQIEPSKEKATEEAAKFW